MSHELKGWQMLSFFSIIKRFPTLEKGALWSQECVGECASSSHTNLIWGTFYLPFVEESLWRWDFFAYLSVRCRSEKTDFKREEKKWSDFVMSHVSAHTGWVMYSFYSHTGSNTVSLAVARRPKRNSVATSRVPTRISPLNLLSLLRPLKSVQTNRSCWFCKQKTNPPQCRRAVISRQCSEWLLYDWAANMLNHQRMTLTESIVYIYICSWSSIVVTISHHHVCADSSVQ